MGKKLPSFQFYPGDWMKDPAIRRCTHAEKGVLVDALCLMFECPERGFLVTNGVAWSDEEIARAIGGDTGATMAHLRALLDKGVLSRDDRGAVFSRRMARDENKRQMCSEAGKRGGNPVLKSATLKGGDKGEVKGGVKPNPTPSSSSSTSISNAGAFETSELTPAEPRAAPTKQAADKPKRKGRARVRADEEHVIFQRMKRFLCDVAWPQYHEGQAYDFDCDDRQKRSLNYNALWNFLDHDAIAMDVERAQKTLAYFSEFCASYNPCWPAPLMRLAKRADQYWQKSQLPRSSRVIGTVNTARPGEFETDLPLIIRNDPGQGRSAAAAG